MYFQTSTTIVVRQNNTIVIHIKIFRCIRYIGSENGGLGQHYHPGAGPDRPRLRDLRRMRGQSLRYFADFSDTVADFRNKIVDFQ